MNEKKVALLTAVGFGMIADNAINLALKGSNVLILSSSEKGETLTKYLADISLARSNQSIEDIKKL